MFIGLTSNTSIPTGDDELNAKVGILLYKTNGGNFRIGVNDNVGATQFSSDLATQDANTHTIIIKGDDANSQWQYSWDGGAFVNVSFSAPTQVQAMGAVFHAEATTAVPVTMRIFDAKLQTDK